MKLLFSRFGGKYKKSKEIINYFPEHKLYVEPFLGSGAIFLNKENTKSILSDLDPCVCNIFKGAKDINISKQFDDNMWEFTPNKDLWLKWKNDINNGDSSLYKSLYVIRHSWNGIGSNFTPNRFSTNNNGYKIKVSNYNDILKNSEIYQSDYKDIIKLYDSEDTLFYLDPPYDVALKKKYYEYQSGVNFIEMRDILKNIKGKFVLSLDITDCITELFKDFNCNIIKFTYGTRKLNKQVDEYLITNFEL